MTYLLVFHRCAYKAVEMLHSAAAAQFSCGAATCSCPVQPATYELVHVFIIYFGLGLVILVVKKNKKITLS